jgi:starch-binding outer membrane protein, SusD/RagB family
MMMSQKTSSSRGMRPLGRSAKNVAAVLALALVAGCDMGLDLTNPNAATEKTATSSLDGMIATSLGMQDQFASSVLTYVRAPALVTDEWGTGSRSLGADQSLFLGVDIDPTFGVVSGPYYVTYRIARTADVVINGVPEIEGISAGFSAALIANAKLFKAMALGMAAQQYERLPINADPEGGVPVPRAQVFAEVIRLLEEARAGVAPYSAADLAGFTSRAVSPGFDLKNTIDAMLARYYLFTGQWQAANDAAVRVSPTVLSVLAYPDPDANPIYSYSVTLGYVAPLRSWANEAEAGDMRVPFWVNLAAPAPPANPPTVQLVAFQKYGNRNDAFPVYLYGEMLLIRAEAQARLGNLPVAVDLINQVRTKAGTAGTPGAQLPPVSATVLDTEAEVLAQIAYERRYELFSQGLRWEDLRRLGTYVGRAPKAAFLPMPYDECQTNPNAGC